jgi:hypothetical protein
VLYPSKQYVQKEVTKSHRSPRVVTKPNSSFRKAYAGANPPLRVPLPEPHVPTHRSAAAVEEVAEALVSWADSDYNGVVNKMEAEEAGMSLSFFKKADVNKDGLVDADEMKTAVASIIDSNKDGKISASEAMAAGISPQAFAPFHQAYKSVTRSATIATHTVAKRGATQGQLATARLERKARSSFLRSASSNVRPFYKVTSKAQGNPVFQRSASSRLVVAPRPAEVPTPMISAAGVQQPYKEMSPKFQRSASSSAPAAPRRAERRVPSPRKAMATDGIRSEGAVSGATAEMQALGSLRGFKKAVTIHDARRDDCVPGCQPRSKNQASAEWYH